KLQCGRDLSVPIIAALRPLPHFSRREIADRLRNQTDMLRRRAAAAADDVQPTVLRPFLKLRREAFGSLWEAGGRERIGQAGIRGLRVQRVENGFDHQEIDAAFKESGSLFAIGFSNLVERRRAEAGIVYIWGKRCGHRQGTERSADKTAAPSFLRRLIGGATCHDCRRYIDFLHERAQIAVIDDALEKLHAFSSRCRFAPKDELVEADGAGAKSVGL